MRTWESLAQEAVSLRSQVYHWPSTFPERIQNALASFDRLCITRLEALLLSSLNDHDKSVKIRRLFSMRWTVVANTSLDYTLNPALHSNSWYIAIAARVASTEEAIVSILMPTIQKVIGTGMEDDIKSSTELSGRDIELRNFILNVNQDYLISIDDVFEYAKQDTHYLFLGDNDEQNKKQFPLTASDRELIRRVTPETTLFYDLLKQVHAVRIEQKPSIGLALFELHEALLRSSKIETGSDVSANMSECQQPILDFYRIWMSLVDSDKNKISAYRTRGGSTTLGNFLLTLFSYTPGIELSDADYAAVDPHIIPCTHMIGQQLQTLLSHNLDLKNMPLPGRELDFYLEILPTEGELTQAKERLVLSLSQRQLMPGENDSQVALYAPFFTAFTDNLLESAAVAQQILNVRSEIKNLSQLKYALLLLPEEKWDYLLLLVRDNIFEHSIITESDVLQGEGIAFISHILKSTLPHSWTVFFEALFAQKYDFFLRGDSLSRLLYEFNESHWQEIVHAMGQFPSAILTSPNSIALLLDTTSIDHYRLMHDLFHTAITSILNTPRDYADLFGFTSREIWPQIFALFSRTLIYFIQNKKFIDEALEILNPARRLSFINLLIVSGVRRADIIANLDRILPHIDVNEWRDVFHLTQINYDEYPSTQIEFLSMLTHIDVRYWSRLCIMFDDGINALIDDPEKLAFILDSLPADKCRSFFTHFYSQRRKITGDYLVTFMTGVAPTKRLMLSELILMVRSDLSIQSGCFADALNLISLDEWGAFSGFFTQYALRAIFENGLNIQQFLKKIPVEKWPAVKSVFSSQFNVALRDETDLILVARELELNKIPAFFELVSNIVKKHITDLSYLKTIFIHVRDQSLSSLIALSVAKQVNKFVVNPMELVAISSCAEAMRSNHNLSSVFFILGKPEIMRYVNNYFHLPNDHDSSRIELWRLLRTTSRLKVVDFIKFTASFAMIFYLVPISEWSVVVELFSDLLRSKMRDHIFLRNMLLFLPSENRLALCSVLIDCFNQYDFSFGSLHHIFAALPETDWQAFLLLVKTKNATIKIESLDELALMVRSGDISSFKKWYRILDEQINLLIRRPVDLARLFVLFPQEGWPVVAEICQSRVIEQLQKVDFLKNTLASLSPQYRFMFLKSISPYFEHIPINTTIVIDIFSMLGSNCWEDVAKLLEKEMLSRVIVNESDLSFILHGLPDNRVNFLRIIKNYLPIIRCDNPEHLVRLFISFGHCDELLLSLFSNKLPEVLTRFISHFMIQDDLRSPIVDRQKLLFNFLVEKSLSILLSVSYFKAVFNTKNDDDLALIEEIVTEFGQIELQSELLESKDVFRQKLKVVSEFIYDVEKDAVREKSESEMLRFVVRERLSVKLVAHFGPHFFHKISQYAACLQERLVPLGIRPNRMALLPQRQIALIPSAPARLFPMAGLPQTNGGVDVQAGTFLEDLFSASPRR